MASGSEIVKGFFFLLAYPCEFYSSFQLSVESNFAIPLGFALLRSVTG